MSILPAILTVLVLALTGTVALAAEAAGRERALRQLGATDVQARRLAAERLGDVGTYTDVRTLMRALRDPDPRVRAAAESSIWQLWSRSGDPTIDGLIAAGVAQMNAGAHDAAIATFTAVIERRPDFAEGWNKRATALFVVGELDRSAADCAEVLRRNPLHFGALAGMGQIHVRREQPEAALRYFERALRLNPNLRGVAANAHALRSLLRDRRGRTVEA